MTAAAAPLSAANDAAGFSKGYRLWLLVVLAAVNALNLADRQGIAILAPAIKADLHLSDSQLGMMLGLGFAIFYTVMGLPIARMAERLNRTRIIAVCVALFGAMAALCGLARSFAQLLVCRIGVSVGDGGFAPPSASLLGDHYPREKRASVMAAIWLGAPIGALLGTIGGGWIAQTMGWRMWFFILSVPAFVVAILAFFTLREPPRGLADAAPAASGPPPSMLKVLSFLLAKPSVRHVLIAAGLSATAMNAVGQFLARFIVSNFDLHLAQAGAILGPMSVVGMASGMVIGGFGVDWAGKFDRRWAVWGPAIGAFVATPLIILAVAQNSLAMMVGLMLAAHVALFVYYTPTLALAQNMVGADMRASSAFVTSLMLGLVGIGLGPTLMGALSDFFAQRAFGADPTFGLAHFAQLCPGGAPSQGATPFLARACHDASAAGVRHALMAVSLLFAWSAVHYALASRHLRRDLDTHYAEA